MSTGSPTTSTKVRSTLNDFKFVKELGRGSYGVVFQVVRKQDNRTYVIKQINIASLSKKEQEDAIKEVNILASLNSPFIVKYYDSFIDDSKLNIVMEFAEHGNLCSKIQSQHGRKLSENSIWSYFIQIALALHHIHNKKILHRDIKSLNVFLDSNDRVKLGDFGVARILSNTKSLAQTIVGTPYYISPELCENKPYGEKSDVWALGCILYELCTLKHPFDALNQGALILKIVRGKYAPISSSYSQELHELLRRCLSRDTSERPDINEVLAYPFLRVKAKVLGIEIPLIDPPKSSKGKSSIPVVHKKDPAVPGARNRRIGQAKSNIPENHPPAAQPIAPPKQQQQQQPVPSSSPGVPNRPISAKPKLTPLLPGHPLHPQNQNQQKQQQQQMAPARKENHHFLFETPLHVQHKPAPAVRAGLLPLGNNNNNNVNVAEKKAAAVEKKTRPTVRDLANKQQSKKAAEIAQEINEVLNLPNTIKMTNGSGNKRSPAISGPQPVVRSKTPEGVNQYFIIDKPSSPTIQPLPPHPGTMKKSDSMRRGGGTITVYHHALLNQEEEEKRQNEEEEEEEEEEEIVNGDEENEGEIDGDEVEDQQEEVLNRRRNLANDSMNNSLISSNARGVSWRLVSSRNSHRQDENEDEKEGNGREEDLEDDQEAYQDENANEEDEEEKPVYFIPFSQEGENNGETNEDEDEEEDDENEEIQTEDDFTPLNSMKRSEFSRNSQEENGEKQQQDQENEEQEEEETEEEYNEDEFEEEETQEEEEEEEQESPSNKIDRLLDKMDELRKQKEEIEKKCLEGENSISREQFLELYEYFSRRQQEAEEEDEDENEIENEDEDEDEENEASDSITTTTTSTRRREALGRQQSEISEINNLISGQITEDLQRSEIVQEIYRLLYLDANIISIGEEIDSLASSIE